MKMKVIDRILLALYAVMDILALVIVGICVVAPDMAIDLGGLMAYYMRDSLLSQIFGLLIVLALAGGAVYLIRLACRREGSAPRSSAAVQNTEQGAVRVSVRAMETLVRKAIGGTEGILDAKTRIINHDHSVTVEIDMAVGIDAHVPNITEELRRSVKRIVEEFSGVAVREVAVLVTEIRDTAPPALPAPTEESPQAVVVEPETVEVRPAEAAPEKAEACAEAPAAEEDTDGPAGEAVEGVPEEADGQTEAPEEEEAPAEE